MGHNFPWDPPDQSQAVPSSARETLFPAYLNQCVLCSAYCKHFPNRMLPPGTVFQTQAVGVGLELNFILLQPFPNPLLAPQTCITSATLVGRWEHSASLRLCIRLEKMSLGPLTSQKETSLVCRSVLVLGHQGQDSVLGREGEEGVVVAVGCLGISAEGCEVGKGSSCELV